MLLGINCVLFLIVEEGSNFSKMKYEVGWCLDVGVMFVS